MTHGLREINGTLSGDADLKICEQVRKIMLISACLINVTDW